MEETIMNETHFEQAMQIISARRGKAVTENQERFQEIEMRIPEIAEINRQLFHTSRDLLQMIQDNQDLPQKLESIQQRNQQAQRMVRQMLEQYGYPTDYLDMHYVCEKCQDTGYINERYCDCLMNLFAKLAADDLNQSVQFSQSDFSSFSLQYYNNTHSKNGKNYYKSMESVFFYCQAYAEQFNPTAPSILMYGNTGLGKTHLSLAIANKVLKKGYGVVYDSAINFLRQVEKEHFRRESSNTDTLELLLSCDLLILDDLGTEFHSQFYQSTVYNIINTRMNRKKPTIISTNLDYNEISHIYEERITSRIFTTYTVLHFVGEDVRVLRKQRQQEQNGHIV